MRDSWVRHLGSRRILIAIWSGLCQRATWVRRVHLHLRRDRDSQFVRSVQSKLNTTGPRLRHFTRDAEKLHSAPSVKLNMRRFVYALAFASSLLADIAFATAQTPMQFRTYQLCRGSGSFCGTRILASGVIERDSHTKLAAFLLNVAKELPPTPVVVLIAPCLAASISADSSESVD